MINLIVKDLVFNKKQVLIGIIASILFSLVIVDGQRYAIGPMFMIPVLMFSFIVGRVCYMEDRDNVAVFLKSLPIPKKYIVLSKYIESLIALVFGYGLLYLINIAFKAIGLPQYVFDLKLILLLSSGLLIYFAAFLFIFFKTNFANTHYTTYVIAIFLFSVIKLQEFIKTTANFEIPGVLDAPYLLLAIAFLVFIALYKLSVRAFILKDK